MSTHLCIRYSVAGEQEHEEGEGEEEEEKGKGALLLWYATDPNGKKSSPREAEPFTRAKFFENG